MRISRYFLIAGPRSTTHAFSVLQYDTRTPTQLMALIMGRLDSLSMANTHCLIRRELANTQMYELKSFSKQHVKHTRISRHKEASVSFVLKSYSKRSRCEACTSIAQGSVTHLLSHSFPLSLSHSLTQSHARSLTRFITHSLTRLLTHLLTRSLAPLLLDPG